MFRMHQESGTRKEDSLGREESWAPAQHAAVQTSLSYTLAAHILRRTHAARTSMSCARLGWLMRVAPRSPGSMSRSWSRSSCITTCWGSSLTASGSAAGAASGRAAPHSSQVAVVSALLVVVVVGFAPTHLLPAPAAAVPAAPQPGTSHVVRNQRFCCCRASAVWDGGAMHAADVGTVMP